MAVVLVGCKPKTITYTITYDLDGGVNAAANPATFTKADLPLTIASPTKEGYTFLGWFEDADFTSNAVTSFPVGTSANVNLFASWEETEEIVYNVVYHLNGGDNADCNPPTITKSSLEVHLEIATKRGYTFDGWYDNANFTGLKITVLSTVGDKELYAKYTENIYNLTYVLNGGVNSEDNKAAISYTEFPYTLSPATKDDFKFAGWYLNEAFTGKAIVNLAAFDDESTTLYAKFEETYQIVYTLNGGVNDGANLSEYSEMDLPFTLGKAAKLGQVFNGWYSDTGFTTLVKSIVTVSETPIILYANFSPASLGAGEYSIAYIMNGGNIKYDTIEELADEFLFDVYTYLGLTSGFEAFKKVGGSYRAGGWYSDANFNRLFAANSKLPDNSAFFINQVEYNQKWLAFFDVLDVEITKVNPAQTFWGGYFVAKTRMGELFDKARWATSDVIKYFSGVPVLKYKNTGAVVDLTNPIKPGFVFGGWYENADFSGDALLGLPAGTSGNKILYAKWGDAVLPTGITISNPITELEGYEEYQLNVVVNPLDSFDKRLIFESSNENVATVSQDGLISTTKLGTTTITITAVADASVKTSMTLTVVNVDRVEIRLDGHGTIKVAETIQLSSIVYPTSATAVWSSEDPNIASVNSSGLVTGVSAGLATIKVASSADATNIMTVEIAVLPNYSQADEFLEYLISMNEGVVIYKNTLVTGYQFVYYKELYGSVSKYWFGQNVVTEKIAPLTNDSRPGTKMASVEYITIHDTASSASGADAAMHAQYVYNGGGGTSWHYSAGDTGIYHQIPNDEVAYHAGDGSNAYELTDTGIRATVADPVITISVDGFWTFNGSKSTLEAPTNDGVILPTSKITPAGIHTAIGANGHYYIGTTWWSKSYGYIGNGGGNRNSIGIESMVNQGSDLYLTWQKTAKLIAQLLIENNLDTSRVKPHNFFSGKNCPQTMRDNNLLQNFYNLVEAEYYVAKNFADYTVSFVSNNPELLSNTGRIIGVPRFSTTVSYTITVTKGAYSKSVTLSSIVPGQWNW